MSDLAMDRVLDVGFGDVQVRRNGEVVWSTDETDDVEIVTVFDFEKRAKNDEVWEIVFNAPLRYEKWLRRYAYTWELVEGGKGFVEDE